MKIKDLTADATGQKLEVVDIKANNAGLNQNSKEFVLNTLDTASQEVKTYQPTSLTAAIGDLEDYTDYALTEIAKHKHRDGFKYVLKIRDDKPNTEATLYKSSYFMEQILDNLGISDYIPR